MSPLNSGQQRQRKELEKGSMGCLIHNLVNQKKSLPPFQVGKWLTRDNVRWCRELEDEQILSCDDHGCGAHST